MTARLAAHGMYAGYDGSPVVRDVDLYVDSGEVVALLGPNGAGKTTTIRTLAGDLAALDGTITQDGTPVGRPLHRRARNGLALVTEERSVISDLTVEQNLALAPGSIDDALNLFPELEEHRRRRVGLLSGGQQQMLALASALAARPRVLLADELSLGLAPLLVHRLLAATRTAADRGAAVLLVEQHARVALGTADRAYVMVRGRIEREGPADELLAAIDDVERAYLGTNTADDVAAASTPQPSRSSRQEHT